MRKISFSIFLCACIWTLVGSSCNKQDDAGRKPVLAVSIEPQCKILEELVDGRFEVFSVMPAGANPETYDPPMSARAKVADAKAYFAIGYLPFEEVVASGKPMVNTSLGIIPVYDTHGHSHSHDHGEDVHSDEDGYEHHHDAEHGHSHDHGEPDPHVWTSVRNAKAMAYAMMAQLVAADSANADLYRANFAKMAARYDSIDALVRQRLEKVGAHSFAVWHPSLSYYARDYGLRQIAVGQESKEMPIGKLKEIIDCAKADSVTVFFFQKEYDSRQAENVNREIGSRLVNINPLAYDWEEQIMIVTDELAK